MSVGTEGFSERRQILAALKRAAHRSSPSAVLKGTDRMADASSDSSVGK